ncbi:MAG: glycosyltransferase [Alphaproteobacteria bacterium]|nr:glycosyltransferase [Alphaproteobacteria bacterium]MBV9332261.1 glycosyltransferase [Alphaproteobacteria bacterium]
MDKIVVAIPTFRRPESLLRLLKALEGLSTSLSVSVLVADNDKERSEGLRLCAGLSPSYRWPLESVLVRERGISQARNALISRAFAGGCDFVAMIDDDEWPSQRWLDELVRMQRATAADLVQGSILFECPPEKMQYRACEGISSIRRPSGAVDMLQGAGNLLIARACLQGLAQPFFDPQFGLSGGEDAEFFVRAARAGKRFAWCDEAIVYGEIPSERLRLSWILSRAFSVGNSDMHVALKHSSSWRVRVAEAAKISGALLLAPVLAIPLALFPSRRLAAPRLFFRAAGKAVAMLGIRHEGYARP